jgi:hypothetical protein
MTCASRRPLYLMTIINVHLIAFLRFTEVLHNWLQTVRLIRDTFATWGWWDTMVDTLGIDMRN